MPLPKAYNPKATEDKIYALWQRSGFFNPDKLPAPRKQPYTIVIPPPNITGELHMGHALNAVIQDILIRQKRMAGFKTLWLPGTDHAGIATQNVVEKELKKQGKTRFDLGKKEFVKKVWAWRDKYGDIILEQLKKLGASCDWSRTRFTLDKDYEKAVEKAFLHYYKKGWIYKGKRIVNWCPRCSSSLSDLELEYQEKKGKLWYIRYPLASFNSRKSYKKAIKGSKALRLYSSRAQYIVVATTRPETMLGDTAVAVHPADKRYKALIGKTLKLPLTQREIPIIGDRLVDRKMGTGAVKVTPAHDFLDAKIAQTHKLPAIQVIGEDGKLTKKVPLPYQGLTVKQARNKVLADLKELDLLEKTKEHTHQIPLCYRCNTTIEPLLSEQWFLKMESLAKKAIEAVKKGKVKFQPKRWEKLYFEWLENIKDWCISRQLWWGHKIPLKDETDVLDTWFSSALWPIATLGWPKKTKDLKTFYPTDVLSTARDIINLWVARMVFSGLEFMKKEPFNIVLVHPTVLTREGKRMSKSLGTGIDPINLCQNYGADATRFGIAWQLMGGQDIHFVEDNIVMGRKFANKIWNASRFVILKTKKKVQLPSSSQISKYAQTPADKTILKQLNRIIKTTNKDLENLQFGRAAHKLYDFFWHDLCDVYIEKAKNQEDEKSKKLLFYVLFKSLCLLHPFLPFVTEAIYQKLPIKNKKKCLMVEVWPG